MSVCIAQILRFTLKKNQVTEHWQLEAIGAARKAQVLELMHELGYSDKVRSKGKKREGRQRDEKERITCCNNLRSFLFDIMYHHIHTHKFDMYIFYIHMHTAWITRTVLQFYRKQFFWIGSLWSTRHGITTLAAWLTGFEFYTQAQPAKDWRCCYVLILMVGDEEVYTKVGETMTIISEGWGWWHPVLHHHVGCRRTSYSEERVTLRHSGPRKTWRVEKGSSLIPLQRTHIHTTCWFWIVWIICALIFSCINEVTAPDFSYSTCSYSIWLLYSLPL